jgi:leader peptidase (prepilin peptidase)/N-methyltransferase
MSYVIFIVMLIFSKGVFLSITISQVIYSPLTWFCLILGLIMGSFFNVCIYRIPRKIFWQSRRSFCVHCETKIPFWQNIPVLSFLFLRGKTFCCSKSIPLFYPFVELLTGILTVYLYWRFPFFKNNTLILTEFNSQEGVRFLHAFLFTSLMLVCSVIDMQHMIIPDVLSLSMILLSPCVAWLHPELTLHDALLGVALGGGSIYVVAWLYFLIRRREGIGMGDAKLLAAIGGWLGYQSLIPTVLVGSVCGSLFGLVFIIKKRHADMQTEIPFGPFLAFGAVLYLLSPVHWLEVIAKVDALFH